MWVHMPNIFKWFNVNLYIYNNLTDNYEKKNVAVVAMGVVP